VNRIVFLILLGLCLSYFFQPLSYLQVVEVSTGQALLLVPLEPGQEFTLIYTHSVHKSPVVEIFTIQPPEGLLLKKIGFKDYGVGMPYSTPHKFILGVDGFFWIEAIDDPLGSFTLRVQEIPQHRLVLSGREINLLGLTQAGSLVRIEAVLGSRFRLWVKERVRWQRE